MSRQVAAVIAGALFIISIVGGTFTLLSTPTVEGFSSADLHEPGSYSAPALPDIPDIEGNIAVTQSRDIQLYITLLQIFEDYGGAIQLEIINNASRPIFVLEVGFEWLGSLVENTQTIHRELQPGEGLRVKAMAIDGPPFSGDPTYRLKMKALELRAQGWFQLQSGGSDWLQYREHIIEVTPLVPLEAYDVVFNQLNYYKKANELIDFDSTVVEIGANMATLRYGTGYNISKVCAIFDYVADNITYVEDPGGDDVWYSPEECLVNRGGDCEDQALLISSMVHEVGGTSRIYLTDAHAFAAVYVGNSSASLSEASSGIRSYYRSDVKLHAFEDDTGYWLFADPLGSLYLGGLAVEAIPSDASQLGLDFTFENTTTVYAIDITGEVASLPIWETIPFWLSLVIITGLLNIGILVSMVSEKDKAVRKCHVCVKPVTGNTYVCKCGVEYHHECLPSEGFCLGCSAPIEHPPPMQNSRHPGS